MVRNFGERRKKKRGQQKKLKSHKNHQRSPNGREDSGSEYEEEVSCREVAIYVPRSQANETPRPVTEQPKKSQKSSHNNAYRSKREQRQRRGPRTRRVYCDGVDDVDDNGYDEMGERIGRMMYQMINTNILAFHISRDRVSVMAIPMMDAFVGFLMSRHH